MPRSLLLCATLFVLLGCGGDTAPSVADPVATADAVDDPRAYVRTLLTLDERAGPLGDSAYAITNAAFVNAVIDAALKERRWRDWNGTLPSDRSDLDRFARSIERAYRQAHVATPEARAQVEAQVRARFEEPASRVEGTVVEADLGIVPGPLEERGSAWRIVSGDLDRGQPSAALLEGAFERLAERHGDAAVLVLSMTVHDGTRPETYRYRYSTARDRLKVRSPQGEEFVSPEPVGGLSALASSSVHTRDLLRCNRDAEDYYSGPCSGW